jgi:stage II sporulation protein M
MKKFSLISEYKKCFSYLKESRKFIYLVIFIFFFSAVIGFFVPLPEEISLEIINYFKGLIEETRNYGVFEMISFLFFNNFGASFFGMVLGVVFGIFSVFNSFMNGFILGFVAKLSVSESGILSLWRIFPHGIFELPAVFISLGLGLKLGTFIFKKDWWGFLKKSFKSSIMVFIFVVVPLLILAAIIEGILIVLFR